MMKRVTFGSLIVLFVILGLLGACLPTLESPGGNQGPIISGIEASSPVIYPLGYSEIKCVASDPKGGELKYTWSSTSGKLSGQGSAVRWDAPDDYGDYHMMVIVQDSSGNSRQGIVTVSVVVRPPEACCGGRGR